MRKAAVIALLGLAALLVIGVYLMLRERETARGGRPEVAPESAAPQARPGVVTEAVTPAATPEHVVREGRVVSHAGPVDGVLLHVVSARPVDGRIFRDGEFPAKRIWLVTHHRPVRTDRQGRYRVPLPPPPAGGRTLVFADNDGSFHGLHELGEQVRLVSRVPVTGTVRGPGGGILADYWLSGERGQAEDWRTRVDRVPDAFVGSAVALDYDASGKTATATDDQGRFMLPLLPGRNTLSLGDWSEDGTIEVDVPTAGVDLGDIRVPPARERTAGETLRGRVVDDGGQPIEGAQVQLWDGNLGPHSHETVTAADGSFHFADLYGEQVIAWTIVTGESAILTPGQCSGRIRLPCATPVVLRTARRSAHSLLTFDGMRGHLLMREGDRWVGDALIDGTERVLLPPGDYHLIVVQRDRILERGLEVREPRNIVLNPSHFRDTTN